MKISGADRAAVLLLSLGEDDAAEVLRLMSPKEVQTVGGAMASLGPVSREQAMMVLESFVKSVEAETSLGVDAEDYLKRVLRAALGESKASALLDRISRSQNSKRLEALKWMDPRGIAEILRLEHPQVIAIVLSYLEPDLAGEVLSNLPEAIRPDVVLRVATLDGIPPAALEELDEIMEKQFRGTSNVKSGHVGGIKVAANLLNQLDGISESAIMEKVKEKDPDLGQEIQDRMFVFDNLIDLDDRGIQTLLREISSDVLIIALKGAEEEVREKIFRNMSKRASEMLRDDLEAKGPVRVSEVETAQKEILGATRRLAEAGEISIGGKGDAYV